jgi:uncharacterized membrane protein
MEPDRIWHLVTNPAWRPITDADTPGYIALAAVALFIVAVTVWTYTGSAASTRKRVFTLIALRLLALLLAVLLALRPAAAITEIPKLPSTLIIVVDSSESMTIRDEAGSTRWEVVQKAMEKAGPLLDEMREDQQTTVYVYHFNRAFDPTRDTYGPDVPADGKQTDISTMLAKLYDKHQGERLLRGLILVTDGRHNGVGRPPEQEILRWRSIGCPVYTFVAGKADTLPSEKDVSIASINPDPSPVAIKSDLKVRARLNAPGFEGIKVKVRLKIDDKQVRDVGFTLDKATDNEIEIETKAPEKPGEYKVTLELIEPPDNQVTRLNDKIETFLTVTKEGVRVLVISKDGWELKGIRRALATDKRFDYVEAIRASEAPGTAEDEKRYDLREQRYDVIVLGDVSPKMLTAVRPGILNEIRDMVRDKGVGLMMTGGAYALGGTFGIPGAEGWRNTPIVQVLPVDLPAESPKNVGDKANANDAEVFVKVEPTKVGLEHYLLRLNPDGAKNREAWNLLNREHYRLSGYNRMGEPKKTAEVLARAVLDTPAGPNNKDSGDPLLVGMTIDKSRVLAFGASSTWVWTLPSLDAKNPKAGTDLHARFWKQAILWLAHQDEMEGAVYARPEYRRLVAHGRQTVRMGLRDKRGDEVPDADFKYQVIGEGEQPDETKAKPAERDPKGGARVSYDAKVPGEYRVVVWGRGKDASGEEIVGDARPRYVVFPEVSDELLQPAAWPDLLRDLENLANGTSVDGPRRADRLPNFLEEMKAHPPKTAAPKPKAYPEWRRDKQTWFLPAMLVLFVAVLGLEWGLRRAWGMV